MKVLSLFSNVGFSEFYLNEIGFDVVVANELEPDRCDFYKTMHPNTKDVICGDICKQNIENKIIEACQQHGPIDLILATPPCQGMSIANAQRELDDIRNKLIIQIMKIFNKIQPKYMLIENVPGMAKTFINYHRKAWNILDFIDHKLPENYKCNFKVLDAKDYLTPQSRKRSICLISENGSWTHPKPYNSEITLKDSIGHLPSLRNGEHSDLPWHFAKEHNQRHVLWMSNTPEGKSAFENKEHYPQKDGRRISGFLTTYKRMSWNKPAPTVTMANGSISSQNNVHPGYPIAWNKTQTDPRVLSIRELLCISGLPEDCFDSNKYVIKNEDGTFKYIPSFNFVRKIIGEMFPPKMSKAIISNINGKNS